MTATARRTRRRDKADPRNKRRQFDDLRTIAHRDIDEFFNQLEWLVQMRDGLRSAGTGSISRSTSAADPTFDAATSRRHIARAVDQGRKDAEWLIDRKLPELLGRVTLAEEAWRPSDDHADDPQMGPATTDGGLNPDRGDERHRIPAGRPDLVEAYEAAERRHERGDHYGTG